MVIFITIMSAGVFVWRLYEYSEVVLGFRFPLVRADLHLLDPPLGVALPIFSLPLEHILYVGGPHFLDDFLLPIAHLVCTELLKQLSVCFHLQLLLIGSRREQVPLNNLIVGYLLLVLGLLRGVRLTRTVVAGLLVCFY
mmetsp:Transcript_31427/g.30772  ORF Transcript_31427/g.30772 Transcript_31427/m.30772 type:complete len:139 (-) Transcript_31427:176-592(-)